MSTLPTMTDALAAGDGCLHARIDALEAQVAALTLDAGRLGFLIANRAVVVTDDACCDGYWLNYHRDDGSVWVQVASFDTPRAAIDAAMAQKGTV